jgi:hypothetical protein
VDGCPRYNFIGDTKGDIKLRAEVEIVFTWWRERDRCDYEVIDAPRSGRSGMALLDEVALSVEADRIVPKRKCLDRYQPLDEFHEFPTLWEQFARIKKRENAIEFVRAYGPLTSEGLRGKGDIIADIMSEAESMRRGSVGVTKLYAQIDNGRIRVRPGNLLDAIWLQYTKAKSEGRANRCPQCERIFAKGPDAGRRKDAIFCSVECKDTAKSRKRSRR